MEWKRSDGFKPSDRWFDNPSHDETSMIGMVASAFGGVSSGGGESRPSRPNLTGLQPVQQACAQTWQVFLEKE